MTSSMAAFSKRGPAEFFDVDERLKDLSAKVDDLDWLKALRLRDVTAGVATGGATLGAWQG